jgi:hypothetical protein
MVTLGNFIHLTNLVHQIQLRVPLLSYVSLKTCTRKSKQSHEQSTNAPAVDLLASSPPLIRAAVPPPSSIRHLPTTSILFAFLFFNTIEKFSFTAAKQGFISKYGRKGV